MARLLNTLSDARTINNIKHFTAKTTAELWTLLTLMPSPDRDQALVDEMENIPAITAVLTGRGEPLEAPPAAFIVTMLAIVKLRVKSMPEEDTKAHFDFTAHSQGLVERLLASVTDTDFDIEFDVSDVEVETTEV